MHMYTHWQNYRFKKWGPKLESGLKPPEAEDKRVRALIIKLVQYHMLVIRTTAKVNGNQWKTGKFDSHCPQNP